MDRQPGLLWAAASCSPAANQAGGLGAGMPLASGGGEAVVNESLACARSLQASALAPGGPANSLGVRPDR